MDRFTGPRVIVNNDVHRVSERKHPARSGLLQLTDVLLETQSRGCHASRALCSSPRNSCEIPISRSPTNRSSALLLRHRLNRLACAATCAFITQRALRRAPLVASAPQPDLWSRTLP
jgi:hypothetical protein